jgi:nitrite reductase (NAD(P)H)
MSELVGTYADEWKAVVNDPARRRQFRQFVNTVSGAAYLESTCYGTNDSLTYRMNIALKRKSSQSEGRNVQQTGRNSHLPPNFVNQPSLIPNPSGSGESWPLSTILCQLMTPPRGFLHTSVASPDTQDLRLIRSAAVKYGDSQLAIFHVPRRGYFATQQVQSISLPF